MLLTIKHVGSGVGLAARCASVLVPGARRTLVVTGAPPAVCDSTTVRSATTYRTARVGLRKKLGQHLLVNADLVRKIVERAGVEPHHHVLEIGPGAGALTLHLLERAAKVTAIELDPRLREIVMARVETLGLSHKFNCIAGDFLKTELPPFDLCVSNIPYQISSPVITRLLQHRPMMQRAVIMFQAEFAQRLTAMPGQKQYSRLSVNMQRLTMTRHLMTIKANQFRPPPKVDSIVAEIIPRASDPYGAVDFNEWNTMLRLMFHGKNKTIRSVFHTQMAQNVVRTADGLPVPVTMFDAVSATCGVADKRANAMSVQEFQKLYDAAKAAGLMFQHTWTSTTNPFDDARDDLEEVSTGAPSQ